MYGINEEERKLPLTSSSTDLLGTAAAAAATNAHSNVSSRESSSLTTDFSYRMSSTSSSWAGESDDFRSSVVHRWTYKQSIVCLAVSPRNKLLFCGTQDSYILILGLETFQRIGKVKAHSGSVLCLHLSENEDTLFSGGSDSLVKIWHIDVPHKIVPRAGAKRARLVPTHTIYSPLDIGDIFSVTWIESTRTVLFGSQNASISYVQVGKDSTDSTKVPADPSLLPSNRYDKFFDSKGNSGKCGRQCTPEDMRSLRDSRLLEVPSENIISYAHNGFVYALKTISHIDAYRSLLGGGIPDQFDDIILSGGGDGVVNIWGFTGEHGNKMTLLRSLDNFEPVLCLETREGDNYCTLHCGLANGSVNVWDLSTYQLVRSFEIDKVEVNAISSCANFMFIGTESGLCKKLSLSDSPVYWISTVSACMAISSFVMDGIPYVASAATDNSVTLWNASAITKTCPSPKSAAEKGRESSVNQMVEVLKHVVAFETVSKQPAKYIDESRKCASFLRILLKNLGAVQSGLLPVSDANPVVLATFMANKNRSANTPRILWYGHYDVIEADHIESWNTNPFEVTAVNGYLYGRGVSDNKGPLLAAIYAAADLIRAKELECDVVFLIEGEEESGSYGFQEVVRKNREQIGKIDWVMLSNSYWLDDNVPCINYGLRGVVAVDVSVWSDKPDRHSGVDGGVSREPTIDLINLLSKLNDDKGRVKLPCFYSTVRELDGDELRLYEQITKKVKGVKVEELMTKWRMPSLTVHNVCVSGPGNSTVIPHQANASLSIRIVSSQDIEVLKKTLVDYLHQCFEQLHTANHIKIDITHEAEPWLADTKSAANQVLYRNLQEAWGVEPIFIREGGSIPSIRFLEKTFNCEAVHFPTGQASDNAHLSNERLRITNLYKAKQVLKKTFSQLPKTKRQL